MKLHFEIISKLVKKGLYFFDYGNSFLKAVYDAGEKKVLKNGKDTYDGFIYPSYVEDIMGPICFDFGYGPFRWVCLSGDENDLKPMILKDISEIIKMDISTVSRIVSSKVVQTDFGVFPLKYFFSESKIKKGEEYVSSKVVKNFLKGVIDSEDKKVIISD